MEKNTADIIPNCLNCGQTLETNSLYCPQCGQKRTNGRISFRQLLADFVDNIFNLDSRTLRSMRKLLWPGLLTKEYFEGKHRTYLHPLRIFLLSTILMVAMVTWNVSDQINLEINLTERLAERQTKRDMAQEIDSIRQQYGVAGDSLSMVLDSLIQPMIRGEGEMPDSINLDQVVSVYGEKSPTISTNDALHTPIDSLIETYQIEGFIGQLIFTQKIKMVRDTRSFINYLIGRITWMVLILMPLVALFLSLLYIRGNFYYVEHFIFSTHVHSFVFIVVALQLFILEWLPASSLGISSSIIAIYVLLAMKNFYGQGWGKTLVKYIFMTMFLYWLLISIALVIAVILGLLFY